MSNDFSYLKTGRGPLCGDSTSLSQKVRDLLVKAPHTNQVMDLIDRLGRGPKNSNDSPSVPVPVISLGNVRDTWAFHLKILQISILRYCGWGLEEDLDAGYEVAFDAINLDPWTAQWCQIDAVGHTLGGCQVMKVAEIAERFDTGVFAAIMAAALYPGILTCACSDAGGFGVPKMVVPWIPIRSRHINPLKYPGTTQCLYLHPSSHANKVSIKNFSTKSNLPDGYTAPVATWNGPVVGAAGVKVPIAFNRQVDRNTGKALAVA